MVLEAKESLEILLEDKDIQRNLNGCGDLGRIVICGGLTLVISYHVDTQKLY